MLHFPHPGWELWPTLERYPSVCQYGLDEFLRRDLELNGPNDIPHRHFKISKGSIRWYKWWCWFIKGGIQQFQVEVFQQYRAFLLFKMSLLPRFNLVGNKYKACVYILNNVFYVQNLPKCKNLKIWCDLLNRYFWNWKNSLEKWRKKIEFTRFIPRIWKILSL